MKINTEEKLEKLQVITYFRPETLDWLNVTVAALKRNRQSTNRTELIEVAIGLLKKKSGQGIERLLERGSDK